ncbi:MAG: PKD domain-containing protein [Balneolaceae bacterium]
MFIFKSIEIEKVEDIDPSKFEAFSLSHTAKIVIDPEGTVFYHGNAVVFDGTTSTANCGSINQYRWQIDDVTVSWSSAWSHTFNLASGESERVFKVQLRVRNTAGKYGYKTIYVTVTRNNKSLYYFTDHLGLER